VTCETLKADTVIVAGAVNGSILAEKIEIRSTGRVYGDVTTQSFSTDEGAFLRGKVTMEEHIDLSELPTDTEENDQIEIVTETSTLPQETEE